ncbi:MAG: hypothetical protein ACWIPJ_04750 [Polaribacter sp.]
MSTNQNKNEEEVDLGSLFVIIGRGFSKLFQFIGRIFAEIFHAFISILIFLKKNAIKIGIAAIIGAVVGVFLEINKPAIYSSELLVQPNFKSTRQLYNTIKFYNDLIKQRDTATLKKIFHLQKDKIASLNNFSVEPIRNENDIINSYDDFITDVDTTTVKNYSFAEFKTAFTDFDYNLHKISVVAQRNDVFKDLGDVIMYSVTNNNYFNKLKTLTNENLNRTDSILKQNLSQVDTLRKVYMQVLLEEAKKESNGTNIDLGGEKKTTKELQLFEINSEINSDLKEITKEKSKKYEVINVISNFKPVGHQIEGITKMRAFRTAILGAVLMLLFLLLKPLNSYLNRYKK